MSEEFRYYTASAKRGVLLIRELDDADLLAVARNNQSPQYMATLKKIGPKTNRSWVTSTAAITAYERGLIDEVELDQLLGD